MLSALESRFGSPQSTFYAAPFWPGAYPYLGKTAPVWETYALFARKPAFEDAEIARLSRADCAFVVIADTMLDGRDDLRFVNTHPRTMQYVKDHFDEVDMPDSPGLWVFKARGPRK
jgi:hypothetical protein